MVIAGAPVQVVVNDQPLKVVAIRQGSRVLVPMRSIFEALNAAVDYDARTKSIIAYTNAHAVRIAIGSRYARVDNSNVRLDVAPQIIAATTYVPLRFVAQSLGAVVGYDQRHALVTVSTPVQVIAGNTPPQADYSTAPMPQPGVDSTMYYPAGYPYPYQYPYGYGYPYGYDYPYGYYQPYIVNNNTYIVTTPSTTASPAPGSRHTEPIHRRPEAPTQVVPAPHSVYKIVPVQTVPVQHVVAPAPVQHVVAPAPVRVAPVHVTPVHTESAHPDAKKPPQ